MSATTTHRTRAHRRHRLSTLVVAAIVAAGIAGAPSQALAGSNGQQVRVCPSFNLSYGSAFVTGYNQNGQWSVSHGVLLGDANTGTYAATGGCATVSGSWWIGDVSIYWYKSDGSFYQRTTCNVPKWNPFTDTKRCDA
jgi:hypothetical protein